MNGVVHIPDIFRLLNLKVNFICGNIFSFSVKNSEKILKLLGTGI